MDIEYFVNRKLTKTGEMPNGDNIYLITEKSVNAIKEQLRIGGVSSSLTSKETIDYEIYAKRKDKEENLKGWLYAMFFTFILFAGIFAILKGCSS